MNYYYNSEFARCNHLGIKVKTPTNLLFRYQKSANWDLNHDVDLAQNMDNLKKENAQLENDIDR